VEEEKIIKNNSEGALVSEEEVWDVINFAQEAYGFLGRLNGFGQYTPYLTNSLLKDVNMNPLEDTSDKIEAALENPKQNEQNLIGYTEWLELNSMLFKRIMGYFANLLSFDLNYVCVNAEPEDYSKGTYKKDVQRVRDFFDKFNYKKEFKAIMKELVRSEAYFGVLRTEGSRYLFQQLPQKYCEITGRFDYGLVFDFDFSWFIQGGLDIDMYPESMQKMYAKIGDPNQKYKPSAKINSRTGGFALWRQTSPTDGFIAFKFSPEMAARVPLLSALMPNIVLEPVVRELQHNSYIAEATKIIYGQVPMLKESATKLKDNIAITPKNLGRFLALLQSALPSAIKVAAAPLVNTQPISFDGNNSIFDSYLKTSAASAGINSRLLYSVDRQNVLETKSSIDVDQNMLRLVYYQFEDFLEFIVNRQTNKYKFKFMFEGFETSIDREQRLNVVSKLSESGIVLDQKYASALGMNPFDFRRMLEETRANKFVENLTPIVKSSQVSSKNQEGRPTVEDGGLSDSGADTRDAGSNEEKSEG
jgi:hypothetical protein